LESPLRTLAMALRARARVPVFLPMFFLVVRFSLRIISERYYAPWYQCNLMYTMHIL
jgi:hypothetical protein